MFNADKSLDRVLEMELDDADLFELRVIIGEIKNLNRSIDEINKELVDRGKKLSGHKNLTSIKGIGDISATILLSAIGDVDDFEDDSKLAVG
jgi:transposase